MMKEKVISFCNSIGLDTVGVIPCRVFDELRDFYKERQEKNLQNEFEENEIEKRINPAHYMEDGKSIISIAFPYVYDEEEEANGFSIYTKRMDYHRVVHGYLDQVCEYIRSLGGKAEAFVDSNTLPERYIAYLAGVGFIGRNNMIITKQYGSYVFLGEIITNLDLGAEDKRSFQEISLHKECGECSICYGECPTKSINANRKNPNICLSYLTQKKEITDQEIGLLKGNVFGCDFCQLKCPYNEKAKKGSLLEFATLSYMNEDAAVYARMDNKYFKKNMSKTSCGWRGKNVLRRNAILTLHKRGEDVSSYIGDSEYINGYIRRLTKE
ncbi:MAG: tRNA epoxyqueuosine(34) reductase QueG [bacterium]|nr:tRNA epoxyqueuosine(34) reductase QueG [bacterium]